MTAVAQPAGTVTLVFTDIEGSTRLLEELGIDAYREALAEHRRVVREACARFDGYEVDYEGDAFFYAFASAQAAVAAVSEAMSGLDGGPIRIRVGIHTGEPALDPPKYVGIDVHRAARIMSAAHGGQVVLSPSTVALLEPGAFELSDLGAHRLKDLSTPDPRLHQLGRRARTEFRRSRRSTGRTCPCRRPRSSAASASSPRSSRCSPRGHAAAHTDRAGRHRQDAAGAAGSGRGSGRLPRRHRLGAARAAARPGARAVHGDRRRLEVREQPGETLVETLARALARQARRCWCSTTSSICCPTLADDARRRSVGACPTLTAARHEPRAAPDRRRDESGRCHRSRGRRRASCSSSGLAPLGGRARGRRSGRASSAPARRAAARDRARRGARTLALARRSCSSGSTQRLDLLRARRDADPTPADAPRDDRLVVRAPRPGGAAGPPRARRLRRRLHLDAAEQVAGADLDLSSPSSTRASYDDAARHGPRYWMLETIRQYAAEQIPGSELAALETLFLDHYAGVVEPLARSRTAWEHPRWFTAEVANLRAALDRLEQRKDGERFGWLVCGLAVWWDWQALFTEGLSRCETALTFGGLSDPLRAELFQRAGQCAGYLGDPRTRHFAEQARKMFSELGDTRGESLCLQELAFLADQTGDVANSDRRPREALQLPSRKEIPTMSRSPV